MYCFPRQYSLFGSISLKTAISDQWRFIILIILMEVSCGAGVMAVRSQRVWEVRPGWKAQDAWLNGHPAMAASMLVSPSWSFRQCWVPPSCFSLLSRSFLIFFIFLAHQYFLSPQFYSESIFSQCYVFSPLGWSWEKGSDIFISSYVPKFSRAYICALCC